MSTTPNRDIERLIALAREIGAVESLHALRDALAGPLAPLLPSRDICLLTCVHDRWEVVFGPGESAHHEGRYAWTPLVAGRKVVGRLGIGTVWENDPPHPHFEAAAALLGLGIQHILAIEELRQHSARDPLTGCFNRGHAVQALEGEIRRASRTMLPLSILMMDLDGFKDVNDCHGHVAGDAALAAVGDRLAHMVRQTDVRCRFGGDEFLVILPDTPQTAATTVAESLRHAIERLEVVSPRETVGITTSIGVATTNGTDIDVPGFIDRADLALYQAKQAGRNRVRVYSAFTRNATAARADARSA